MSPVTFLSSPAPKGESLLPDRGGFRLCDPGSSGNLSVYLSGLSPAFPLKVALVNRRRISVNFLLTI